MEISNELQQIIESQELVIQHLINTADQNSMFSSIEESNQSTCHSRPRSLIKELEKVLTFLLKLQGQ